MPLPRGESSSRPRGRVARVMAAPPAPGEAHEGEAAEGDREQEDIGDRSRAAEVERAPSHEGVQRQRFRGDARAAIGQHVGQIDDLERLDHPDQHQRDADRQDGRDGEVAKHLPARGAIDHRRLDLILGLRFQAGQEHDEHERDPLPRVADHDGDARTPGGGGPGEVAEPEPLPERGERTLGRVRQHPERIGDAHRRDHHRDEEHDPEEAAALELLRAQESEPEADQELDRHPAEDIDQRDARGSRTGRRHCPSSRTAMRWRSDRPL